MKVLIYADNTLPIQIQPVIGFLNSLCRGTQFQAGTERFRIRDTAIKHPDSYERMDPSLRNEIVSADLAILATNVPYENNYFFEAYDNTVFVSFFGWNVLTDLPVNNGLAYFIASLMSDGLGLGESHDKNTGCVNDFWWDKSGIDAGMRSAYLCASCMQTASRLSEKDRVALDDITVILNAVSNASRLHRDLLDIAPAKASSDPGIFDVFMCHNSADKEAVRELSRRLTSTGVKVWLDEEQLPPGRPWQPLLEQQIGTIRSAAVCVGPNGTGPWQNMELRGFLNEFVERGLPVIPVILPRAPAVPELPLFLRQMTWVDMRTGSGAFDRLVWAITGKRPGP